MKKSLYTPHKIFHFKEKLDSLPADVPAVLPPVHIRIKPTNVCNHNCSYCAYRVENLQLGQDMNQRDFIPQAKMMEIIDDIVEMGVKAVTFSGGGDPFCYPYLHDAVRKLASSPVRFACLTNGSRLHGELADLFAHHAVWVRVSMDGWDDASYSEYRRVPMGSFTKLMDNVAGFKNLGGRCYLGVVLIVDRKNAGHVFELTRRLREAGVDSIKISPCIVSNDGAENNAYHQPVFDLVKSQIQRCLEELASDQFEIFDAYHHLDEKFAKDYTWCPYLQILPVIGADQNVYSCQDKAYNLQSGLIGSIKECRFKDFWFSDKSKFFRINPARDCNHHCVANSKNQIALDYLNADTEHRYFV